MLPQAAAVAGGPVDFLVASSSSINLPTDHAVVVSHGTSSTQRGLRRDSASHKSMSAMRGIDVRVYRTG